MSCGLTIQAVGYCWGANDYGRLGDGGTPEEGRESASPVAIVGDLRFATLYPGATHTCGITLDARAFCWGWNRYGQLGNGSHSHSSVPIEVAGDQRWLMLALGELHTCGLTDTRLLYCWGNNARGQLGNGRVADESAPQLVAGTYKFVAITASSGAHTCALTQEGSGFCWGRGDHGQLGTGIMSDSRVPTAVVHER
ncbi:MAG: RCC1 domain-containing protein [Gemmatimonadaceae bacterium]